jgi:uncharacterized protein YjbI with pentapeptide repeats
MADLSARTPVRVLSPDEIVRLMRDACLREADMSGAQLDAAVLTGADLRKANLRGAGFRNARPQCGMSGGQNTTTRLTCLGPVYGGSI